MTPRPRRLVERLRHAIGASIVLGGMAVMVRDACGHLLLACNAVAAA